MKQFVFISILATLTLFVTSSCSKQDGDEFDHQLVFPTSAKNFQNAGDSQRGFLDRGIVTVFEMDQGDLKEFLKQLEIDDRRKPLKKAGDPTTNGWNVWPQDANSWVPANKVYDGLKKAWIGDAVPVEMLSCQSPVGDWLHVEIWKLEETLLLKIYTDWN